MIETVAPFKEAIDAIKEAGGDELRLCWQCGLCTASCPWNTVRTFMPHKMIRQTQFGLLDLEEEDWWLCTTCKMCESRCPRGVGIIDILRAARNIMTEYRMVPESLRVTIASLGSVGNPWGEEREKRPKWVKDMDVKAFSKDTELFYFTCCVTAYDPELTSIARATARILQKTGANFGILGAEQSCCAESVRKGGNKSVFEHLVKSNVELFNESGVKNIVVTSPHCYTTFKDEYPEFGGNYNVRHFTQYLAELIDKKKLKFKKQLNKKIVYHDPCYLGRHQGIYDEPRKVLSSIPGVELMDEVNSREESMCCGGGGGRIFMETKKGERFSDILVEQAVEMGAEMLVTACPYCILNFKDSALTVEKGDTLEVKDIAEVVQEVI